MATKPRGGKMTAQEIAQGLKIIGLDKDTHLYPLIETNPDQRTEEPKAADRPIRLSNNTGDENIRDRK